MKRVSLARTIPAVASALVIGAGLAAMNDSVRVFMARMFTRSAAASQIRGVQWQVQDAVYAVYQAVKDQSLEHAPLMIFVVAAGVLLLFMLRT
jgi:hypothetical protein